MMHSISLCAEIHRSVKPCQLLNSGFLSMFVLSSPALLAARGFLGLLFRRLMISLYLCIAKPAGFSDGLSRELMMKRSRLGRKPEGAITCEYFS